MKLINWYITIIADGKNNGNLGSDDPPTEEEKYQGGLFPLASPAHMVNLLVHMHA